MATHFTAREWRDYLDEHNVEFEHLRLRENLGETIYLDNLNGRGLADIVSYNYSADGEFENLLVAVPGDVFADFLEGYSFGPELMRDFDVLSSLESFLAKSDEIEINYSEEGTTIQNFFADIPPGIENVLADIALPYLNGSFMDEPEDSDEPTDETE